jgi:hypothetical protein
VHNKLNLDSWCTHPDKWSEKEFIRFVENTMDVFKMHIYADKYFLEGDIKPYYSLGNTLETFIASEAKTRDEVFYDAIELMRKSSHLIAVVCLPMEEDDEGGEGVVTYLDIVDMNDDFVVRYEFYIVTSLMT